MRLSSKGDCYLLDSLVIASRVKTRFTDRMLLPEDRRGVLTRFMWGTVKVSNEERALKQGIIYYQRIQIILVRSPARTGNLATTTPWAKCRPFKQVTRTESLILLVKVEWRGTAAKEPDSSRTLERSPVPGFLS